MIKWTLAVLIIFTFALSGCASQPEEPANTNSKADQQTVIEAVASEEPDRFSQIYQFQHRLLPEWTFNSEGLFFTDLMQGDTAQMRAAAASLIDEEYAENLIVTDMPEHNAVLIEFPKPFSSPLCYYVLIIQEGENFQFITYERTLELEDEPDIVGVVGFWRADQSRGNDGPRTYATAEAFVKDVLPGYSE